MKIAEVRFLGQEEKVILPKWTKCCTEKMRENYIRTKKPFTIEDTGTDRLLGTLSHVAGQGLSAPWREKAELLLEELAKKGAAIVIPPYEGEFPRKILPFAEGALLTPLFAFSAAAEALRRQGKNPEEAHFVIAGSDQKVLSLVLSGMGDYVNHLAFFTDDRNRLEDICQELYEERGLLTEIFSSAKNPLFSQGDVVIVCGMEQTGYEHILKKDAIFIEAVGNRPVLRRLAQRRWDVVMADGFFFSWEGAQLEGRNTEARLYQTKDYFRVFWENPNAHEATTGVFDTLRNEGLSVCGFSALGNRIKIVKL